MRAEQARNLVVETFTQPFDRARFSRFAQNLLNHLDTSKQKRWSGNVSSKEAFKDKINHYERLGSYEDPNGEKIDVLAIYLKRETTLERGRTSLRNFAADYLTQRGKAAVLAAFVSQDPGDWRFSFVKLEYALEQTDEGRVHERKELAPARRYSFLVGNHEGSHTAQKQFLPLLENDTSDPTLAEIEKAFDIEKVTKEFFARYKELFENVRAALDAVLKRNKPVRDEFERRGIETDDFAKKLLGQIVFLYFLQKKGWFGVKRGQAWGTGDKNYLRHLFEHRAAYYQRGDKQTKRNFFNDILEPLFYNTLAIERTNDYADRFDCKIPFLNGGLFEPLFGYDWVETDILLPDALFSNNEPTQDGQDRGTGILDVFDRYNFTVNEAEPLEKDVAVDPEMLGKVFENLLPENLQHKGGTYYTPRRIVNYMCQQSLINYLSTHLPDVPRETLETFIRIGYAQADFEAAGTKEHQDKFLPDAISRHARQLDKLLEEITVCDPAIGSGAFPVGMMQEIVRARLALAKVDGVPTPSAYHLKRHAIQSSLYGVDIDAGAIEIAKLRLWLSLVVDEDDRAQIQALPNLDYKIMQGNSLLDEFAGVKLLDDELLAEALADKDAQLAMINARINELQDQFFELDRKGVRDKEVKQRFVKEIETLKRQKRELLAPTNGGIAAQGSFQDLHSMARTKLAELKRLHREFFDTSSVNQKKALRERLEAVEWEFMEATLKERGEDEALRELARHRRDNRRNYFLWKLHFVEVFQAKGGFDVVIGNPPYGAELTMQEKDIFKAQYSDVHTRTPDTFNYFISKSLRILRTESNGLLSFIVPNNLLFQNEYSKTRELLLNKNRVLTVLNLGDAVFENAIVPSCVLLVRNQIQGEYDFQFTDLRTQQQRLNDTELKLFLSSYSQQDILQTPGHVFGVNKSTVGIIKRVESLSVKIDDIAEEVASGISTGGDKIFRITTSFAEENNFENSILHKVLKGREINRYSLEDTKHLVIYTHKKVKIENNPNIYKYLKTFKEQLSSKRETMQGKLPWWCLHWPRYPELFEAEKILIRQTADELIATLDDNSYYALDSLLVLKIREDSGYNLRFVLAVINSILCNFVYKQITQEEGRVFAQVKSQNIRKLYIPQSSDKKQQAPIVKLARRILAAKRSDPQADVSAWEREIDRLVYQLYELTDDEIAIVEESVLR